ncbi:MAG TPA: LptA/OstA family protein [Caulobacteraceae bacterium]|jgi:lipopolysaccharide export system protein LptA|nr:LptA/OstA family protein [Caulobacteraceae bacterium]
MRRLVKRTAALLALGALVTAVADARPLPAAAQAAARPAPIFGAGSGPIDISADELEVVNSENRAVWKGNVEAIQGTNRLRAPLLTVYFAKSSAPPGAAPASGAAPGGLGAGFGSIQRMEAEGPVYYVTQQQNARGDHATYEAAANQIVMTGNVVLVQDKNVVQGDRLTIDTVTNHSTLVSTTPGRGQKRVRGVFYQGQNAAPAAKP